MKPVFQFGIPLWLGWTLSSRTPWRTRSPPLAWYGRGDPDRNSIGTVPAQVKKMIDDKEVSVVALRKAGSGR